MILMKKMSEIYCQFMGAAMPVFRTKRIFKSHFGKKLNLDNPVDINEKIQWLKLNTYRNNPTVTTCADKYRIREWLKSKGFENLLPELYGVYNSADDIRFDELPESFVIKCNHGCGFNIICADKSKLDIESSKRILNKWMKQNIWKEYAELQYKDIKKKIIAEQFLGKDIITYKFYCFNGNPKVLYISSNGENGEKDYYVDYFDMNWNHLDITLGHHAHKANHKNIEKPKNFKEMQKIACELSKEFPFVRVDLYNIAGRIYISELTFVPTSGFMHLEPEGTSEEWGSWLKLP